MTSPSRLADPPRVNGFRAISAVRAERVTRWANRTDGKLALLVAAVIVVGIAAGLAGTVDVRDRAAVLDEVAGHSGPLTVASVEVYRALSDADATSASAFLAGGTEPADLRQRYLNDVAAANAALSTAAAGAPTGDSAAKVAELANLVPTYTGLVETARTYNRQGLPVGAAYLREASELVRSTMLPAAQRLYEIETDRLAAAQSDAGQLPWFAIVLGLLLIAGLAAIQFYLARRTRRLLNRGLLVATALALASLIWLIAGAASSAGHSDSSRTDGTAQLEALAEARIAGLQARSDEAMTLVARGNGAAFEQHFDATAKKLTEPGGGLLERAKNSVAQSDTQGAVDSATGAAQRWIGINTELRKLDKEGRYTDAVTMATGPDPNSSGSLARDFDGSLGRAIQQATDRFDLATAQAKDSLSGLAIGVITLCLLAVIAAAVGMWPRIAEYR